MAVSSINLAQNLITTNRSNNTNVAFKGGTPDLDALKQKQDEFRRMSEQAGEKGGVIGKIGSFATKAIGVVIAFTATKICLDKAAGMISDAVGKYANSATQKAVDAMTKKASEKTGEEATKLAEKAAKLAEKMEKSKVLASKVQRYAVNVVAGGAALGVAMKDFGLVKKEVSDSTENLVERSIDKANGDSYNHDVSSDNGATSGSDDFNISDDEF